MTFFAGCYIIGRLNNRELNMKFIHTDIDKTVLPKTKGKKVGDYRFYDIDGVNYPSVTSVLSMRKSEGLKKWR